MATATIGGSAGFNLGDFWIPNLSQATNIEFKGETGRTGGTGPLSNQTITYSILSFEANGYRYAYQGEWAVEYDRGLLIGSVSAAGHYDKVVVSAGGQTVASFSGNSLAVDFGTQANVPLVDLLSNVLSLLIDGNDPGEGAYENLNTDATPDLAGIAFAGADTIRGSAGDDTLSGQGGHDRIFGGSGGDTLSGGAGDDWLDGGAGADTMTGGIGNDTFLVGSALDKALEAAGGGIDTVLATVSYTLGAGQEIENLRALDPSGTLGMSLRGNEFANSIRGNAGNNLIDGGVGADSMRGLGGNDTYYVDNRGDRVYEALGGGNDTIWTSITHGLARNQEVENLKVNLATAGSSSINLYGNEFDNTITGSNGRNFIDGGGGTDTIFALGGNDRIAVHQSGTTVDGGNGIDAVLVKGTDHVVLSAGDIKNVEQFVVQDDATLDLSALAERPGLVVTRSTAGHEATVIGSQGADRFQLSSGNADITGGTGNDVYYASSGTSTLHFNEAGFGRDVLYNGQRGDLVLDFAGLADDMGDLTLAAINGGRDVQITTAHGAAGDALVVHGMTIAQLTANAEFTFV